VVIDDIGNDNGVIDPGETGDLTVFVTNTGSKTGFSIQGVLSESDPYLTVTDADGAFGNVVPGDTADNSADRFTLSASSSCPMGYNVTMTVSVNSSSGYQNSIMFPIVIGDRSVIYADDFSVNAGWTGIGGAAEWTIGRASGGQGNDSYGGPDPTEDHSPSSDNQVLGNDLTSGTGGDYAANLGSTYWVTSPTIDCSNFTGVILTYWHWLGVERNQYDHAYFEAFNGTSWVNLFANGSETIDESSWGTEEYDLSAIADGNANFKIRIGLGGTDGSWQYCGWNIDDILLKGYSQGEPGNPELAFSINSIADSLIQGDSSTYGFKIYNIGDSPLRVTFSCDDSWLGFNPSEQNIAPLDSIDYGIVVHTLDLLPGSHPCTLSYASNDVDHQTGGIPITIFIYAPNVHIARTAIGDTLSSGQQTQVPLTIDNTGPGRLFYSIDVETLRLIFESAAPDIVSMDNGSYEPIGYRVADEEKNPAQEPYYPPIIAGQGGPDVFGYRWIDSDEPGGPAFGWIDITTVGTEINPWPHGTVDDGWTDPIAMGMTFEYYGIDYADVAVSTNGWVSFQSQTSSYLTNSNIPSSVLPNGIIAVEWDDLDGGADGHCYYYYDSATNQFIVSWVNWQYYASPYNPHDFQVILSGNAGSIITQYRNNADVYQSDITVGIENETGSDGLQVTYNADYLHNDLALKYSAGANWLSVNPESGAIEPFQSATVQVTIDATDLEDSTYTGELIITSNDPDQPSIILPVTLLVRSGCAYLPGDINGVPPANGIDVTFGVTYFKGGAVPPVECPMCPQPAPFYGALDVNASCTVNGIDITYFVGYLKGGPSLIYCLSCPPAGLTIGGDSSRDVLPELGAGSRQGRGSIE
jgi:hypothetical protein